MADSPIGDFISSFPTPASQNLAAINVYKVSVTSTLPETWVHFDLYDHVTSPIHVKQTIRRGPAQQMTMTQAYFAPFSHDSSYTGADGGLAAGTVPEPASLVVWSFLAVLPIAGGWWRRRRRAARAR